MQKLALNNLKAEAEINIKPKQQNNPFNKKKNNDVSSIPSLNVSQLVTFILFLEPIIQFWHLLRKVFWQNAEGKWDKNDQKASNLINSSERRVLKPLYEEKIHLRRRQPKGSIDRITNRKVRNQKKSWYQQKVT